MRSASRSHLGLFLLLLVFASGLGLSTSLRGVAQAAGPHIGLSQKVGPPTTSVQVNGAGFGHSEPVLVDVDTTKVGAATTDATGKFVVRITVPKSALPGTHAVRATGQSSGLTALALFLVQVDWTQFHFGLHHKGYNPYENVLTPYNVSALTRDWSYTTGGSIVSSPAVAGGLVYVSSADHKLYALHAVTGTRKWSYTTGYTIYSSPAVANGVVYVGSDNYKLYALDAMPGARKWSFTTGCSVLSSPAVANGVVYVGSVGGQLYALDAMTGPLKWSYTTGSIGSSPAVAGGVVYVGSADNKLYALDAVTGTRKWSYTTGSFIQSSPAVANGLVYVGSSDDKLYALDAVTGRRKWSYTTGGYIESSPAVANGVVYVGSFDDNVYAFHLPGMS